MTHNNNGFNGTLTTSIETIARQKLDAMIQGHRTIVNDAMIDLMCKTDYGSEIRSCRNRQRCGIQDAYVAWIHDSAKPTDLEFKPEGYAIGSI